MYRTLKTAFSANRQTLQHLFDIRRMCGTIWNDCVQLARYYDRIHGSWINQSDLQSELKGLYPLHSQTVQAVCHKFLHARDGVRKARKTDPSIRYPYKEKFVFHPKRRFLSPLFLGCALQKIKAGVFSPKMVKDTFKH